MGRLIFALCLAAAIAPASSAMAGPVSAGQGMGPLGPRSHECQPGNERADRDGCRPFRSNAISRWDDIRCAEVPTRQGFVRVCRD